MSVLHWLDFGVGTEFNSSTGTANTVVDGVDVSITGVDLSTNSDTIVRSWPNYTAAGETFDPTSTLKIYSGGIDSNTAGPSFEVSTLDIAFGDTTDPTAPVAENVSFRLNALGGDGSVGLETAVVKAYDSFGNEVALTATPESNVTAVPSTDTYVAGPDVTYSSSQAGSVLFESTGQIARIEILYTNTQEPASIDWITLSDVHFDAVEPAVDHARFPSEAVDLLPDDDHDSIDGTSGDDTISTGDDADTINGGDGNDSLDGGWDDDVVTGGGGADTIDGGRGNDTIDGGTGDDSIDSGGDPTLDDYSDYESISVANTPDDPKFVPSGVEGYYSDPNPNDDRDLVYGHGGNDYIFTGDDADTIFGGDDNDTIDGGIDDDSISGDGGADSLIGGHGSDTIDGGFGDDYIDAGNSTLLYANEEDSVDPLPENDRDYVFGGGGDDTVYGGDDNDTIEGGSGRDELHGGIDQDLISGGADNDILYGDQGDDTLYGDAGNDTFEGGDGADVMSGGDDRDYFQNINAGDAIDGNEGGDDFDTIDLRIISAPGMQLIPGTDITFDNPDGLGGTITINYDTGNFENGTATYFDAGNVTTGSFEFTNIENIIIPCFTPGTRIATARGELCVEDLDVGDRIITRDNGIQEIRWIGKRELDDAELTKLNHLRPVMITKGALGNGLPERDMKVSPNHRMLVSNDKTAFYFEESEVLVAAKHLVGLPGVEFADVSDVTYIHFMFDQHEVVLSDGAWSESFQPGDWTLNGIGNAQRTEILELFPELARPEGIAAYQSARRSLRKFEAQLLVQ